MISPQGEEKPNRKYKQCEKSLYLYSRSTEEDRPSKKRK